MREGMMKLGEMLWPSTLSTRLFLLVTFAECIIDVTIEAILFYKGQILHGFFTGDKANERDALPVYLGLFAIAHLFQLILAAEAVFNKNTFSCAPKLDLSLLPYISAQGITVFNALFLIYSVIQIGEVKSAFADLTGTTDPTVVGLTTAIPIVISLTEIAYIALSWQLYKEFGWSIFKSLGADRRIRRYYLIYQIFICALKFDYFFFLAFSLQFILLVLGKDDAERWLTVAATPIILLILILGYFAVRREKRRLTWTFMGFCVIGMGYFTYKLVRIYAGSQTNAYLPVRKSLTTFSVLALLMVVFTFAITAMCLRNFDKGLRYHFQRKERPKAAEAGYLDDSYSTSSSTYKLAGSAAGSRLSID